MAKWMLCAALAVCAGASQARAGEILTERCSGEVAIVPSPAANPTAHGTVLLKRNRAGQHPWTSAFRVQTNPHGEIRWWCHSVAGNVFDAGTWRIHGDAGDVVACLLTGGAQAIPHNPADLTPGICAKKVKLGSSAFQGWTPERSRCRDRSATIRARLGPDRLLQLECMGR